METLQEEHLCLGVLHASDCVCLSLVSPRKCCFASPSPAAPLQQVQAGHLHGEQGCSGGICTSSKGWTPPKGSVSIPGLTTPLRSAQPPRRRTHLHPLQKIQLHKGFKLGTNSEQTKRQARNQPGESRVWVQLPGCKLEPFSKLV